MMYLEYSSDEDRKKHLEELISNIEEKNISEFIFNGVPLYITKEYGHAFLYGFYNNYITKSGIFATRYYSWWHIDGKDYDYKDNVFIERIIPESKPIDWNDLYFPIIKNVSAKTIADDLVSVKPKLDKNE